MGITARGVTLLVGAVVAWGVGRLLGVPELSIVAAAATALVVAGAVAVRLGTATVSVRRSVTASRILPGDVSEAVLELRNDGRVPAALLLVSDTCHPALADAPRFVVPGLVSGGKVTLRYPVEGRMRGRYPVGPLKVRVRDPFGTSERVRRYHETNEILVYPRIERLEPIAVPGANQGSGSSDTRRLFNTGDEFYTMREYASGDDLRQVHWPSTARRQTLMVRQQEQPWQASACVLCDTRRAAHRGSGPDSTLELAVSATASALWHLADRRYELRLATEADLRPPTVQPWNILLDRLAEAQPSRVRGLGAALERVRTGGGDGLLVAVVAAPPGDGPVARHPDVRALLQARRGFAAAVALVVQPVPRAGSTGSRGDLLAALLRGAGWRAATIVPGQSIAERWSALATRRSHGSGGAYQPDRAAAVAPAGTEAR